MDVSIVTVGDELLAGDVVDTNAAWLASRLADRGARTREIVTVPDDADAIAERVREAATADAAVVTGGVGGTPDDVTMDGVAAAFDRPLEVREEVAEHIRERYADRDLDIDVAAWASLPAGSRPLLNEEGLSPGCVIEDVYVLPGIPAEMQAMFEGVADEFAGDRHEATTRTARSESAIVGTLERAREEFGVSVGSYPEEGGEKRIAVVGDDRERVVAARDWLDERL